VPTQVVDFNQYYPGLNDGRDDVDAASACLFHHLELVRLFFETCIFPQLADEAGPVLWGVMIRGALYHRCAVVAKKAMPEFIMAADETEDSSIISLMEMREATLQLHYTCSII